MSGSSSSKPPSSNVSSVRTKQQEKADKKKKETNSVTEFGGVSETEISSSSSGSAVAVHSEVLSKVKPTSFSFGDFFWEKIAGSI